MSFLSVRQFGMCLILNKHYHSSLFEAFNWILYAQLNTQFRKGLHLVTEKLARRQYRQTATAPGALMTNNQWSTMNNEDSKCIITPTYNNHITNANKMTNTNTTNGICPSCGHNVFVTSIDATASTQLPTIIAQSNHYHSLTLSNEEDDDDAMGDETLL